MSNEEKSSKRQTKCSSEDDLVCTITLELPFGPVFAEDGRVYERAAIEKHFEQSYGVQITTSPMTGLSMGKRLVPATQHKNTIEACTGDLANKWKEREKKDIEKLMKKAEDGDVEAMEDVAENFFYGDNGFTLRKTWKKPTCGMKGLTELGA